MLRIIVALVVVLGLFFLGFWATTPTAPPDEMATNPEMDLLYMGQERLDDPAGRQLSVYCYRGRNRTWADTFRTVIVNVNCMGMTCNVYSATQHDEVYRQWKRDMGKSMIPPTKEKHEINIHPFNPSCVGVEAVPPYSVVVVEYAVDLLRLTSFLVGSFVVNWGPRYLMDLFAFVAIGALTTVLALCNGFLFLRFIQSDDGDDFRPLLFYPAITVLEGAIVQQLPAPITVALVQIVARLLILALGNFLVNWGINYHQPTMFSISWFRGIYAELMSLYHN